MNERVERTPSGRLVQHGGSGAAYAHYGCRCEECVEANTRRAMRRRKERTPDGLPPEAHGKSSTYANWNCRCKPCTAAWNVACNKQAAARKERAALERTEA